MTLSIFAIPYETSRVRVSSMYGTFFILRLLCETYTDITMIETSEIENRNQEFFSRLERLMQKEAPYLNPDLTRRQLAEMLATNENYLYQALCYGVPGKRYNDYINGYRLDHAVRLLIEMPEAKIETITVESGFHVRQTFYRYFQARYGIPPLEYQKNILQMQEEEK